MLNRFLQKKQRGLDWQILAQQVLKIQVLSLAVLIYNIYYD